MCLSQSIFYKHTKPKIKSITHLECIINLFFDRLNKYTVASLFHVNFFFWNISYLSQSIIYSKEKKRILNLDRFLLTQKPKLKEEIQNVFNYGRLWIINFFM